MFCIDPWASLNDLDVSDLVNRVILLKLSATDISVMNVPAPEKVADSMANAIQRHRKPTDGKLHRELPLPQVTQIIPRDILRLASDQGGPAGRDDRAPARVARSRVVFVETRYTPSSDKSAGD